MNADCAEINRKVVRNMIKKRRVLLTIEETQLILNYCYTLRRTLRSNIKFHEKFNCVTEIKKAQQDQKIVRHLIKKLTPK
jgi:hypothetical protein